MPCDAIAVATGQVPLDLARTLDGLGTEAVAQALLAFLRGQFAHLGWPEPVEPRDAPSGAPASAIGIRLGRYLLRVSPQWQVAVNIRSAVPPGDDRTAQQIRDAATRLLTGLAGLALQRRVAQAIRQAGYSITGETRVANDALVLGVEL